MQGDMSMAAAVTATKTSSVPGTVQIFLMH